MTRSLPILASLLLALGCTLSATSDELAPGIDLAGFDHTVRPQDDFDAYVNGTWRRETEIPTDKSSWGGSTTLSAASEQTQHAILDRLSNSSSLTEGSDAQRVADFYASFMDVEAVDRKGATPLEDSLEAIFDLGGASDVVRALGEHLARGIAGPLRLMVFPDLRDSSTYTLYLIQSGLTLPDRDYYLEEGEKYDSLRTALLEYAAKLFELAGVDGAGQRAQQVVELEQRLAQHQWPLEDVRDIKKTYNPYSRTELEAVGARLDWDALLESLGATEVEQVVLEQPSYTIALGELLHELPLEQWQSYIAFRALHAAAPYLSQDFVQARFELSDRRVRGVEEMSPRWQRGVRNVNALLGEALGKLYVEEHFPPEAKARMEELVAHLVAAYGEAIAELDWMTPETRIRAREKLEKFTAKIGYPDRWRSYDGLEIRRQDLLGNVQRAALFDHRRQIDKLGGPIDRHEWQMTPQTVNAYHDPTKNEIVFPAAILQPPFFDMTADDAVNYGAIGVVIGHEMGHAFDDQGRHFDGDGNLSEWWSEADAAAYEASSARLVEQYDAFEVLPGLHVNGKATLGENIGDLTGLTIALRAYRNSLSGREAPVVGGLTGEQRFFVSFAQLWRTKHREETLRRMVLSDPHAPARFRALGPLRNTPEFYEAFGVTESDGMWMAPSDRVKIW